MKKTSVVLISGSVAFMALMAAVLGWYGYFSTVTVQKKPIGPFLIVYQKHTGTVDTVAAMDEIRSFIVEGWPEASLIDFTLTYDDPKQTSAESCRVIVGSIVEHGQEVDLHAISEKYAIATVPRGMAAVCDYPYKNKPSLLFGILKGYPALLDYADTYAIVKRPVLALYDVRRGRIRYALFTTFEPAFFEAYLLLE